MQHVTGIIMAGGKNTRMGKDKALLSVGGWTMVENAANKLKEVAGNIMVITSTPGVYSHLGLATVDDIIPGCGPLGGLYTGLVYSQTNVNLVVACDMPFLEAPLLEYLARHGKNHDVVIPRVEKYLEPMVACYNKSCITAIEEQLRRGNYKITSFFSSVDVYYVDKESLSELADLDRVFFNVNTPRDLKLANKIKERGCYDPGDII